jgi:autotransporter-associated beta strand protein
MGYTFTAVSGRSRAPIKVAPETVKAHGRGGKIADRLSANIFPMNAETENFLLAMTDERSMAAMVKSNRRIKRSVLAAVIAVALFEHGQALAQTDTIVSSDSTTALTLTSGDSLTIDPGVTLNVNNGKNTVAVEGSNTIVNDGTLEETGEDANAGRAIRDKVDTGLTLVVENFGTILTADDDDIQAQFSDDSAAIYNYGTIISQNSEAGGAQGIDLNAISTRSNFVYNAQGALIEASEADAVRPGVNGVIDNAGKIFSFNAPTSLADPSDGIDAQANTGVEITNESTGVIEGARHGITGGNTDVTTDGSFTMDVSNAGVIQGDDGSGINIDGFNGNELVTVNNSGTIIGNGVTTDQDGDGVDVDGLVNLNNTGTIVSEHAFDDASEGVTVGGGTIVNSGTIAGFNSVTNADGSINTGIGRGITLAGLDKDPTTDATIPTEGIFANSMVVNSGLIYGQNGGAIAVTGAANDFTVTIINEANGTLESSGSAAVVFTGGNDSTVIDSGTIKSDGTGDAINLGSGNSAVEILGGSASVIGNIDGGTGTSTLTIEPGTGNSFTYGGVISDFSSMTVDAGTVILNGDSSGFTGATDIEGGTLEVGDAADPGAALGGDVMVASGGMLRGHGTIDGNVTNAGTVFPGGSIGTLTVNGNFTQEASGILNIEVAGTGSDQLNVTGTATLAGGLSIQVDPSFVFGSKITILSAAGGVNGSFSSLSSNSPLVTSEILDDPADPGTLVLEVNVPTNSPAFSSGRIYAANSFVTNQALFSVMNDVLGGNASSGSLKQGAWMQGLGNFGSANGYNFNEGGFIVGAGTQANQHVTIGAAVSSLWTGTNGAGSSVSGNSAGFYGYGIYTAGRFEATAMAGVGHIGDSTSRLLAGVGTGKSASNGDFTDVGTRLQYSFGGPRAFVAPYVSGEYLHTSLGQATETGVGQFNLAFAAMGTDLGQFGAGVKTGFFINTRFGTVAPWVEAGGLGTVGNTKVGTIETLGLLTANETATAAPQGAITAGAGVDLAGRGPWRLSAQWGGQYGSATSAENFAIEGHYSF